MYYSDKETILSEIGERIADGKTGCIVFDFGAILPYSNNIVFNINLGVNELPDQKLNHRYPNKAYRTISRKYGRRVSKIGYPYFFPLDENNTWLLIVEFGVCEKDEPEPYETIKAVFPLKLAVTKNKPVCGLSLRLHLDIDKAVFNFESHYYHEETGGWGSIYYTDVPKNDNAIPLQIADIDIEAGTVLYATVLEPYAQKIDELMI